MPKAEVRQPQSLRIECFQFGQKQVSLTADQHNHPTCRQTRIYQHCTCGPRYAEVCRGENTGWLPTQARMADGNPSVVIWNLLPNTKSQSLRTWWWCTWDISHIDKIQTLVPETEQPNGPYPNPYTLDFFHVTLSIQGHIQQLQHSLAGSMFSSSS